MTSPSASIASNSAAPRSTYELGPLLVKFVSITFEGARVHVSSRSKVKSGEDLLIRFANDQVEITARLDTCGDHFISFGEFSFSGFQNAAVEASLSSGGIQYDIGTVNIYRLPLVPFFRDAHADHHDSFFFLHCGGQYAVYGKRGAADYPDRGVFVLSSDADQNSVFGLIENLEPSCLDALRNRQGLLYLDQSHEGNAFEPEFAERLHRLLDQMAIDADLVFFANHTFNWATKYEHWAGETQLGTRINVVYSHWYADGLMFHERDYFAQHGGIDEFVRLQRFRAFSGFIRPKRFFSMNYTPRPHRVLLMLKLIGSGQLDDGIVSFGGVGNADKYKGNYYDMNGDGFIHAVGYSDLLSHLPALEAMGALTVDQKFRSGREGEAIRMSATMSQQPYDDSYFSIVTESEMVFDSDFQRVTEKIYKPLLRLHPLIVLGNANSFDLLEAEGFRTFGSIFDQSYDKHPRAADRVRGAFSEIDRLVSLPMEELAALYRKIWPALEHNIYHAHDYMSHGLKRRKRLILDRLYDKLVQLD